MSTEPETPDDKTTEPTADDRSNDPSWLDEKPHPAENALAFYLVKFVGFERVKP